MKQESHYLRIATYIILSALAISIIPLLIIARYNTPCADDYAYGKLTFDAWNNSNDISVVLQTAIEQTIDTYQTWQGSFSAIFLMALQPGIFNLYSLASCLIILSFILSYLLLFYVLCRKLLKLSKNYWLILFGTIVLSSLQFIYSPVEGLFWYNGSVYYTFFHCLSIILISLIVMIICETKKLNKLIYVLLACFIAFFIGGGNLSTALLCFVSLFFICVYQIWKRYKNIYYIIPPYLFLIISFAINILAPGNAIRQESVTGYNPIVAIVFSFVFGAYSILNSTTVPALLIWLLLSPVLWMMAKKSNLSFKYPLLFSIISFCIFCTQATPPLYAIGINLPERLINLVYYNYWILIALNLYYWYGWFLKKLKTKKNEDTSLRLESLIRKKYSLFFIIVFIVFAAFSLGKCTIQKSENGGAVISNLPLSASAVLSLIDGSAEDYHSQALEREKLYLDKNIAEVVVPEFRHKPFVLFQSDISSDVNDFRNKAISKYYGKKSVKLQNSFKE